MVAGKFSDGQYESLPSAQSYQTLVSVYKLALSLVSSKTEIWARLLCQLGNAVKLFNVLLSSQKARCLKITEKVSFNIASEARYVYISSGQKLIKNPKNGQFWQVFEKMSSSVTRHISLNRTKIG